MNVLRDVFLVLAYVSVMNVIFIALILLAIVPLFATRRAAYAVARRNFVGYFSNPTGYVFICLFVILCSLAAYWPAEFFQSNIATLHQLNIYLPAIMLIFVPATTMSVWAEERSGGTDELLLTLPAADLDIVLGKFIASAGVFTVALLFSQYVNCCVLGALAFDPALEALSLDVQLIFSTYVGYWLIGLAMISIGMVASFVTSNLTVAFVLGLVFNVPLVVLSYDQLFPSVSWVRAIAPWSIGAQLDDFTRGVLSLSGFAYFAMLTVIGLYLCMVLIGKRHWIGGRDGRSMIGHFIWRAVCLFVITIGLNIVFSRVSARKDISEGQVSALSQSTIDLIRDLDSDYPVQIEAYISRDIPADYLETKTFLINTLKEFDKLGSNNITVKIYDDLQMFGKRATYAAEQHGIEPQSLPVEVGGKLEERDVIMGAAFRCGLEKRIVKLFEYGVPVEYELARTILTITKPKKKALGIVRTDAPILKQAANPMTRSPERPELQIVGELRKQYNVEEIIPDGPIETESLDVMVVVQPSQMGRDELNHVINAINAGVPTAIFEDPVPITMPVGGTGEPRRNPMGQRPGMPAPDQANLKTLWKALGINVEGKMGAAGGQAALMGGGAQKFQPDVVWQRYTPYPKLARIGGADDTWVFTPMSTMSQKDPITTGLRELFFPVSGTVSYDKEGDEDGRFEVTELVRTTGDAGRIDLSTFQQFFRDKARLRSELGKKLGPQTIAARIRGDLPDGAGGAKAGAGEAESGEANKDADKDEDETKEDEDRPKRDELHVVYVADIDILHDFFIRMRERPNDPNMGGIKFRFDNVIFLLNVIDSLAGDETFLEARNKQPRYSTLKTVEAEIANVELAKDSKVAAAREKLKKDEGTAKKELAAAAKELEKQYNALVEKSKTREITVEERRRLLGLKANFDAKNLEVAARQQKRLAELNRQLERDVQRLDYEAKNSIESLQSNYKLASVLIPPIPLLIVGLAVFVWRRSREKSGAVASRLR